MIAIDTNVLARILADDPGQPAQVRAARALASGAKKVFVPMIVQVKTVWILESGYGLSKETVVRSLEHLEVNQAFRSGRCGAEPTRTRAFSILQSRLLRLPDPLRMSRTGYQALYLRQTPRQACRRGFGANELKQAKKNRVCHGRRIAFIPYCRPVETTPRLARQARAPGP